VAPWTILYLVYSCCCVPHPCLPACYIALSCIYTPLKHFPDDAPCIPIRLADLAQPQTHVHELHLARKLEAKRSEQM
jgi:hypothetical protein